MNSKNTITSMSWFHSLKPGLIPALLVLSTSCQSQGIPVTPGGADHGLDAYFALDTAYKLCHYSRGTLPNWQLWSEFQDYLSPSEVQGFRDLERILLQQIPAVQQPKAKAVATYIARHTTCFIDPDLPTQVEIDETGARGYVFKQTSPAVPNVPPPPNLQMLAPQAQTQAWVEAFERAPVPNTYTRNIKIVVEPGRGKNYILRSDVQKMFAEPLKIQQFWTAIESYKMQEAFEELAIACVQNTDACENMREYWASSELFRRATVEQFLQSVDQTAPKLTLVALTGTSSYTAAEITLTNHSQRTFSNIIFATDEVKPQYCQLQQVRTRREDRPLTLRPGESRQAYCALHSDTRPWVELSAWIADSALE